jgi:acetyl-CoA synthetase
VPIFTGFGADAIAFRMAHSGARVLCTHGEFRARVPALDGARVVTVARSGSVPEGDLDFEEALRIQREACVPVQRRRDDSAVLLYTSGSTGPPKGVKIAANFILAIHPYMHYAVDLRSDDVFWPTGDPGWGYGLVCYMVALAMGVPVVSHEAAPTPEYCLERLAELGVTNLATTPTLLRGIMALGEDAVRRRPVRVRCASSCGEPLNAEVVAFFRKVWGVTIMDQYGASEFGLPIGNFNALTMAVKPGSMGLPLPGCRMAVVDDGGRECEPDEIGHIAMWPSVEGYYSLGYWQDEERTREMTRGGGWLTIGDLGRRDVDGYFWFEGRADDVIKSAGYRIGPFEVESAILHHPAVAEAAVVGKPDPLRGHIVKAYVVLRPGVTAPPGLADEIVETVKQRVGRHQYPREIEVVAQLPKTETGKIQRFVLRQQ